MAILSFFFFSLLFVAGCAPKWMQDQANNQYFEKITYADIDAPYLGEWTAATGTGLSAIKIDAKGNIKMCSSNQAAVLPYFSSSNGKVFKEDGKIKMILDMGYQYEIVSVQKDHLIVNGYGQDVKFYSGKVPGNCREVFDKFSSH